MIHFIEQHFVDIVEISKLLQYFSFMIIGSAMLWALSTIDL